LRPVGLVGGREDHEKWGTEKEEKPGEEEIFRLEQRDYAGHYECCDDAEDDIGKEV